MASKKHPILLGLLGLAVIFTVFLIFIFFAALFLGGGQSLALTDKIAVLPINGVITDPQPIIEDLRTFADNDKVRAIVVRIDSPGGSVGPSQEIYQEVKRITMKKPVVASVGSMAASGGYYIACASDQIISNPGAITGSIGVIVEYANFQELMEKIGLQGVVIKSGKYKDIMSPIREMSKEERALIQNVINDIHSQFIAAVAESRNIDRKRIESLADGRIFTGLQAQQLGLIDSLGTLYDAVQVAAELVGIEGQPEVVYPERKRSLLEHVIGDASLQVDQLLSVPYRFSYMLTQ